MIRAAIRLLIIYALAWLVSLHWDAAYQFTVDGLQWLAGQYTSLDTVWRACAVFLTASLAYTALQLPLWICTLRVDPLRGPRRHPFARVPLRKHLRFRPARFVVILLLQLLGLLLMLRALPVVFEPAASQVPAWMRIAGQLSDRDTWVFYALMHLVAMLVGWIVLLVVAELFTGRRARAYGFTRYQFIQAPVSRMLVRLVAFGLFPVAAFAATSHAHPMHAIVVIASLCAVLFWATIAQVLTLRGELANERWLDKLDAGYLGNEAVARLRTRSLLFLHPGLEALPAPTGPEIDERNDVSRDNASAVAPAGSAGSIAPADPWAPPGSVPTEPGPAVPVGSSPATNLDAAIVTETPPSPGVGPETETKSPDTTDDGLPMPGSAANPRRRWPGIVVQWWVTGFAAVLVLGAATFAYQWLVLPSDSQTRVLADSAHVHVRRLPTDAAGNAGIELLGTRYDYSLGTSIENVSPHFINAVIASEDHRFFEHGVVYKLSKFAQAAVRCIWRRVSPWVRSTACRGNSTIGQQLARNLFLSEERSLIRKFKELVWSIKMETSLTKREILQAYLNRIYLGRGNFGVEMAARSYFGKSAAHLGLYESALLAAAVKRPSWNWHQDRTGATRRAKTILLVMRRYGFADPTARFPDNFRPRPGQRALRKPYLGHLWQWIRPEVQRVLTELPPGDYKLLTTLNAEVQVYARRRLSDSIRRMQGQGVSVSQGAVVVMRPNGAVLAMVGGVGDDLSGRGVNRAKSTDGLFARPPASAFKPLVYLAALETGLTPDSTISAAPVQIDVDGGEPYSPQNHDGKKYGDVRMRDALVHSINTAAVNLLHDVVGFDRLFDVAARLGLDTSRFQRQWGLALGQSGVPVVDMAGAYAAFANGGYRVTPHAFLGVTDEDGRAVWRRGQPRNKRLISLAHVSDLNSMLQDAVAHGTGFRARRRLDNGIQVAGKTGTGDRFVDAWFIGYTADLVIAVWLGNDRPTTMKNTYGGGAPARIFNDILRDLKNHTGLLSTGKPLP